MGQSSSPKAGAIQPQHGDASVAIQNQIQGDKMEGFFLDLISLLVSALIYARHWWCDTKTMWFSFSDPSSKVTELKLSELSRSMSNEDALFSIGLRLDLKWSQIEATINNNPGDIQAAAQKVLMMWNHNMFDKHEAFVKLCRVLKALNRTEDIATILEQE